MKKLIIPFVIACCAFTLCPAVASAWFSMPDDCDEIIVERALVNGVSQKNSVWDISEIEIVNDNAGYRVKRFCDSSFLYTEGRQRIYFSAKGDSLLLNGYENRLMKAGIERPESEKQKGMPVAIVECGSNIDFNDSFMIHGRVFQFNEFDEYGTVEVSNGTGLIVMGSDTLRNARTVRIVRSSDLHVGDTITHHVYETELVYSPLISYPILEMRRSLYAESDSISQAECYVLTSVIDNGVHVEEIKMEETVINPLPVAISSNPSSVAVSFMVDRPFSDVEITLCSLSGVVYCTEYNSNVPAGEYSTEIPTTGIPHNKILLIVRVNDSTTKKIIAV